MGSAHKATGAWPGLYGSWILLFLTFLVCFNLPCYLLYVLLVNLLQQAESRSGAIIILWLFEERVDRLCACFWFVLLCHWRFIAQLTCSMSAFVDWDCHHRGQYLLNLTISHFAIHLQPSLRLLTIFKVELPARPRCSTKWHFPKLIGRTARNWLLKAATELVVSQKYGPVEPLYQDHLHHVANLERNVELWIMILNAVVIQNFSKDQNRDAKKQRA